MISHQELRQELINALIVRQAHMDFVDAVADFPEDHLNTKPPGCDYSFWHLLEHLRICQRDILDYIQAANYEWLDFPDGYWPDKTTKTDAAGWQETINAFLGDRNQLVDLLKDPAVDLFAPLPNSGERQHNLVREIQIISAHNAYHTGELAILRQVMGLWPS